MSDNTKEIVFEIISQKLNIPLEEIDESKSFIDDYNADSLDLAELVMGLEEQFNISVPENVAEEIKTPGQAVAEIDKLRQG